MKYQVRLAAILTLTCISIAVAGAGSHHTVAQEDMAALIEQLPGVTEEVVYYQASYFAEGSPLWPFEYGKSRAHLNEAKSTSSPLLRRIVARGADAVPFLILHLRDRRPVKSGIAANKTFLIFSDHYDFRYSDPRRQAPDLNLRANDEHPEWPSKSRPGSYMLKVGDLCFAAIGQIVNRRLHPVVAHPGYIVNSPVERPALAAAVQRDWGGLTRREHERSLTEDLLEDNRFEWGAPVDALDRLCYFYPGTAERTTLRLLGRPIDDSHPEADFVQHQLLPDQEPAHWRKRIDEFAARFGAKYRIMIFRDLLRRYALNPRTVEQGGPSDSDRKGAGKILRKVFPSPDWYHPPAAPVADSEATAELIDTSNVLPSKRLDQAVLALFRSAAKQDGLLEHPSGAELVAEACMDRLIDRRWNQELLTYCRERIHSLEASPRSRHQDETLRRLRRLQQQLSGQPAPVE